MPGALPQALASGPWAMLQTRPKPLDQGSKNFCSEAKLTIQTWHPEYKKILRPEYHEKFDTNWKYHLDRYS